MSEATRRNHASNRAMLGFALMPATVLLGLAVLVWPVVLEAKGPATVANEETDPAWAQPRITQILGAFRRRLPAYRALNCFINRDSASLEGISSANPENVERYEYSDGIAAGPQRIRWGYASRDQARLGHLIDWDTVSAEVESSIPTLVRQALAQTRLEGGGSVEYLDIVWFPDDQAPTIRVHIKGQFQDALVVADTKGQVLSVKVTD